MKDQNSHALDTGWEAAMLNIKLGSPYMFFMLDNILLPLTLQSLSDTLFSPLSLAFSITKLADHWNYFYLKEVSRFGLTLHSHQLEGSSTALDPSTHCGPVLLNADCICTAWRLFQYWCMWTLLCSYNLIPICFRYHHITQHFFSYCYNFRMNCFYCQKNKRARSVTVQHVWFQDMDLLILPHTAACCRTILFQVMHIENIIFSWCFPLAPIPPPLPVL